ncbi:MAG: threonine--tRNA ligase [Candidatus Paceibacterota bacterium]|nr:MAG: threonine--tRNA ligase [Candidatus Paceibacterota bacterium]
MAQQLEHIRHSLAHLLAAAVIKHFPDAQRTLGPAIEHGFYYDFLFPTPVSEHDLEKIEATMRKLLPAWTSFTHREVSADEAREAFKGNPFKLEMIEEIVAKGEPITLYTSGEFTDLCRGGHVENPAQEIPADSFKLEKLAGAYWRGDETKAQLTRIYGLAFESKEKLEAHIAMVEEAKKRDHKILGPALDLFTFSDLVGAGLPLWTPKGTLLRNILDDFVWSLRAKRGYMKVEIPHITKKDLYVTSGHWEKFKDDLFRITTREKHEFAMKPMNCPHHTQIYARKQWSYRELPQRYANTTMCYRDEQSGELSGLSRVRSFAQDDAHVFCRMSQAREEFLKIWDIIHEFYTPFGFELRVRLSRHDPAQPEKYLGDPQRWEAAEGILRDIVKEKNVDAIDGLGEAAFYGPKLDFLAQDSLGREWQVATIQLDMNMPERFDLTCVNEKAEKERIVMIHAAIMGSIERFLSIAIEHFAGAFPLWLAPVQVAVLPISEKQLEYAQSVVSALATAGFRVELRDENESIGKKIRAAEMMKIPYLLVVGAKEVEAQAVAVRQRGAGDTGAVSLEAFIGKAKGEIAQKSQ